MPKFQAACFDLDGTLIDTTPLHLAAEADAMRVLGVDPSDPRRPWTFGLGDLKGMALLAETFGVNQSELLGAYIPRWHANVAAGAGLRPGARELLGELESMRVPMALVTSGDAVYARTMLESCGISALFRAVVSGDDVEQLKPHPEPYLRAAGLLGIDPVRCVGFEDSPAGLASLRGAGMYSVAVARVAGSPDVDLSVGGLDAIGGKMLRTWFVDPSDC